MKEKIGNNKSLAVILAVLILAIVGLVVGVIIVNNNKNKRQIIGVGQECYDKVDGEEIRACLYEMDKNEDENVDEAYSNVMNAALESEEYELFVDTAIDRAYNLAKYECDKALSLISNEELASKLPDEDRQIYYERAMGVAFECNDDEKYDYFMKKRDEIEVLPEGSDLDIYVEGADESDYEEEEEYDEE